MATHFSGWGARMKLVRNNADDPRVLRDLEMLASEYGDASAVALLERDAEVVDGLDDAASEGDERDTDAAAGADGAAAEPRAPTPLDDGFVRTFVTVAVHVRRYLPYYVGACAWALVMLLMAPRAPRESSELAGFNAPQSANLATAGQTVESALTGTETVPSFSDIGATPSDAGFGFSGGVAAPVGDVGFDGASATIDMSSFDTGSFDTSAASIDASDEPEPLRISKHGYSSRTGGTPAEQEPPSGGMPVAAVGGQATKRSFFAVEGGETVLRLKLVDDSSNVGDEQASLRVCPIVVDEWKAEDGQAFDTEPAWSTPCVDGKRGDDGTWTFDLSTFGKPADAAGFALTPGEATGTTFHLTFSSSAVSGS